MAKVIDRWHKSRPGDGEPVCAEHGKVPSAGHNHGDRWQVRYRDSLGQQRKENFSRKPAAETRAKVLGGEQARGVFIDPAAGKTTFQDFAEDWRSTRTHDLPTAVRVERELRLHVYPVIGRRTLRELAARPTLVQAWIAGIKLAPSSARQVIKDVSAVFNAAADDGMVNRNPLHAKSISRPKVPEVKAVPWTLTQVSSVADALAEMRHAKRYAVLPYLGAGTGMRQGELFALAVDDIDFLRRVIHVRRLIRLEGGHHPVYSDVKNDRPHDVPLAESLAPLLSEHIRQFPPAPVTLPWQTLAGTPQTHRLVLTTVDGMAVNRNGFNRHAWRPALVAAGIKPGRRNGCHVLRHSAASAWLAAGVDIATVAAFLGDTVATIAKTYAHLMPDADDRARRAMDAFFTGRAASAPEVPSEGAR